MANFFGNDSDNTLTGDATDDFLEGNGGSDTINGGAGFRHGVVRPADRYGGNVPHDEGDGKRGR